MNKVLRVSISKHASESKEVVENAVCICGFCHKYGQVSISDFENRTNLGHGRYFCSFCLRNRFNTKLNKHVLLMDFRGIIGYYVFYLLDENKIYKSQILDYIRKHSVIGLRNPAFSFDPETLLWYVDFSRIGSTLHKVSMEQVNATVDAIIDSFNIDKFHINDTPLKQKYHEALAEYYKTRTRPAERRILSPTLKGCIWRQVQDWDETRNFYIEDVAECYLGSASPIQNIELWDEEMKQPALTEFTVHVKQKTKQGKKYWQGLVCLPGLAGANIVDKQGNHLFEKKEALNAKARSIAKKLGVKVNYILKTKTPSETPTTPATT